MVVCLDFLKSYEQFSKPFIPTQYIELTEQNKTLKRLDDGMLDLAIHVSEPASSLGIKFTGYVRSRIRHA